MNIDTEQFASAGQLAFSSLVMFTDTPEAKEGMTAFNEKRAPDFSPYRGQG
jgi:naphthoate synthase